MAAMGILCRRRLLDSDYWRVRPEPRERKIQELENGRCEQFRKGELNWTFFKIYRNSSNDKTSLKRRKKKDV